MKRYLWLFVIVCLFLICTGCGDTFRPVIIPNPPKFPDPRAAHTVVTISDNGGIDAQSDNVLPGSVMVVDVTGDSNVSVADCQKGSPCIGIAPVHAVQQTATQVLVVNQSVPGVIGDSLSKVNFSGTTISSATTISLPPDSAPTFVAVAPSDTTAYVTLPSFAPPSVGVVSTSSNALLATIPVGNDPVAIAVTPDRNKLYVANQGSNSISAFNTLDRSPRIINGAAFTSPLWLVARTDSQRVFVLNGNGTLTTLDTTADTDTVIQSGLNVGAGAKYMVYDSRLNRLYIPSGGQLTVVDVAPSSPQILTTVAIATVSPALRNPTDVCFDDSGNPPPNVAAVAVAALPDGSRAYVGSFYSDGAGNLCPQVTVINTSGNTFKTSVAIPGFPDATVVGSPFFVPVCTTTRFRFNMTAGGDSSRVYLSSCDGGNVNFIDTANDTYLQNLKVPASARPPIPPSNQPPPQNPVFMIAGP
jgi:DNA-binding beta-propeller fold protein YncE